MKQDMDSNYNFCLVGVATDTGQVRKANEDSMAVFEAANMKVFVVCDGMGGHVGGKIASETAIAAIKDFFLNNVLLDPRETIHNAIIAANEAILSRSGRQPELSGMGSTCVILAVTSNGKVYYGHVGDSRIYIIANRQIKQLTKDHSFVQMLVDARKISQEEAERHPRKNEITNALGIVGMQPPTVCNEPIEPEAGNCFLLCSDGLTGMVDDTHLERVISNRNLKIQQRAEKLIQLANAAGGVDNITVQLVEFALGANDIAGSSGKRLEDNQGKRKKFIIIAAILFSIAILGGTIGYFMHPKKIKTTKIENKEPFKSAEIKEIILDTIPFIRGDKRTLDTKIPDSIKTARVSGIYESYLQINEINDKKYIVIQWKNTDFKGKQIEIFCEDVSGNIYQIKIPIFHPQTYPEEAQKNNTPTINSAKGINLPTVNVTDTVTFSKELSIKKGEKTIDIELPGEYRRKDFNEKFHFDRQVVRAAEFNTNNHIAIELRSALEHDTLIILRNTLKNGKVCIITVKVVLEEIKVPQPSQKKDSVVLEEIKVPQPSQKNDSEDKMQIVQ